MELLQKGLVCCYGNPFDFMVRFELDLESQFLAVGRIVTNANWDVAFKTWVNPISDWTILGYLLVNKVSNRLLRYRPF